MKILIAAHKNLLSGETLTLDSEYHFGIVWEVLRDLPGTYLARNARTNKILTFHESQDICIVEVWYDMQGKAWYQLATRPGAAGEKE